VNLDELERKLWQAARRTPPQDAVPYGFEPRVMARLRARSRAEHGVPWSQALWRAALACLALSLLCGALSWWMTPGDPLVDSISRADLSQALETAVFASVDQTETPW